MKINAYPRCGSGDFGVQGSGKSSDELDKRKGTDRSLPASMISFNPSEDMEGVTSERKRDVADETIPGAVGFLS
jgi:hypothetical protein